MNNTLTVEQAVVVLPIEKQGAAMTMLHHLPVSQFDMVSERDNLLALLEEGNVGQFYQCLNTFSNKNYAGGEAFTEYQRSLMVAVLKASK
jgi:hypothetical protein